MPALAKAICGSLMARSIMLLDSLADLTSVLSALKRWPGMQKVELGGRCPSLRRGAFQETVGLITHRLCGTHLVNNQVGGDEGGLGLLAPEYIGANVKQYKPGNMQRFSHWLCLV